MHASRRGSCCDGDHNNLGTRLKQPTIWTVAETELVSPSKKLDPLVEFRDFQGFLIQPMKLES